jgi:predicted dehydrogenase
MTNDLTIRERRVRYGMVGGGERAFIGSVHRQAAAIDNQLELVCGAFASDPERSRRSGEALYLDPKRCYADYRDMFMCEAELGEDERMEFVTIVTPNYLHYPVASAALAAGFHVLSDKPATVSLAEAQSLREELRTTGLLYGLTHPYTAYPMVVEARQRVARGDIGTVRKVLVEYTQGWLAEPIEHRGDRQASWRLDPRRAGSSSCMADIGVHAFHLAETVTGLQVTEVCAVLNQTVPGRVLEDDGGAFLQFDNGAHGVLLASQICVGDENNLHIRVYGDAGSLEWSQQEPNSLWLKSADGPAELLRAASAYLGATARANSRTPPGHPEGYIEAFANIYRNFAEHVRTVTPQPGSMSMTTSVPGIRDALRGMAFIEAVVASRTSDAKWLRFPDIDTV